MISGSAIKFDKRSQIEIHVFGKEVMVINKIFLRIIVVKNGIKINSIIGIIKVTVFIYRT